MMKKVLLFVLIVAACSLQIHAQMDEHEMSENESPPEGSGKIDSRMVPSDDEDDFEQSGSGEKGKNNTAIESVPTTTTTTTTTESISVTVEEIEEKTETPTTQASTAPPVKVKNIVDGAEADKDSENDNTPEATPTQEDKFPKGEETEEIDVKTDLETDTDDDVDIKAGSASSLFGNSQFLAALIAGSCVGLLFAICIITLIAYRMRKKDEGSYALDDESKPASPSGYQYTQGQEYFA